MALTYLQARTIVQRHVADSSDPTFIDQCLDLAILEFARARRWPELMERDFFNTVAAYETGTVAITTETADVALTGGTFPTDLDTNTYRFALSVSDPWYDITTRTDGTNIVLTDSYVGDTVTTSDYIVYKSHYSMPSTVDRVEEIWLHKDGEAVQLTNAQTDQKVTQFLHYPSGPGTPTHWYSMERDADGNRQVLLGPETPDDVYRVEYVYRKKATPGDLIGNFDATRWRSILALTLSLAYAPEFYDRSITEWNKYKALIKEEWSNESESEAQGVRVGESRVLYPGYDDFHYLLGRGRVDPS